MIYNLRRSSLSVSTINHRVSVCLSSLSIAEKRSVITIYYGEAVYLWSQSKTELSRQSRPYSPSLSLSISVEWTHRWIHQRRSWFLVCLGERKEETKRNEAPCSFGRICRTSGARPKVSVHAQSFRRAKGCLQGGWSWGRVIICLTYRSKIRSRTRGQRGWTFRGPLAKERGVTSLFPLSSARFASSRETSASMRALSWSMGRGEKFHSATRLS